MPRLRSIDGKSGAREPVIRVSCHKCSDRFGFDVRAELVQLRIGADLNAAGRIVGGRKVWGPDPPEKQPAKDRRP